MEILLISIFTFFAFYGVLHIVMEIVSGARKKEKPCRAYTVIPLKNCESDVEGIIRAAAWRQLRNGGNEIYAVDLDSTDGTYDIIRRLALEYEFLKAFGKDEYIEILNNE